MSKLARALFSLSFLVVTACATSTRKPAATPGTDEMTAGAEAEDSEPELADADDDTSPADESPSTESGPCPVHMVLVATAGARFCVDKYEASLVEVDADGTEKRYPHWLPVDGHTVRAASEPGVFPQGFISEVQAEDACAASGKRLCSPTEWKTACMGPAKTTFPYGEARKTGVCHDAGKSAVGAVFGTRAMTNPVAMTPPSPPAKGAAKPTSAHGAKTTRPDRQAHVTTRRAAESVRARASRDQAVVAKAASKKSGPRAARGPTPSTRSARSKHAPAKVSSRPASVEPSVWAQLNDPRLGQVDGALARTGSHESCESGYGAVDMVGNIHEWVKTDPSTPHGTFQGGYYLDTSINGDGCNYRTSAHAHDYHDYSTGFRCCAEAPAE